MNIKIKPSQLSGSIPAVPSKSYAHRLLIASALSDRQTVININGISNDVQATVNALTAMGASASAEPGAIVIDPLRHTAEPFINCGESGTTARLLLPVAASLFDSAVISGEGSLVSRPFETLCDTMEQHGCAFQNKQLPISFKGRLRSGDYAIRGDESSQYISGLMFALPLLYGNSTLTLTTELQSSGYVDMTLDVLAHFGVNIGTNAMGGYEISGEQKFISPGGITVEGDWSNAAFWLAAGISVTGLNKNSLQKDKLFMEIKDQNFIDASEIPDLVPVLAVYAAANRECTRICNIDRLRLKESDRVASTIKMLHSLGAKAEVKNEELFVYGNGRFSGGIVEGANDHRIVMAATIASCRSDGEIVILGAEAVDKSYPSFFKDFSFLGGQACAV